MENYLNLWTILLYLIRRRHCSRSQVSTWGAVHLLRIAPMFSVLCANSRLTPLILASPPGFGQAPTIVSVQPALSMSITQLRTVGNRGGVRSGAAIGLASLPQKTHRATTQIHSIPRHQGRTQDCALRETLNFLVFIAHSLPSMGEQLVLRGTLEGHSGWVTALATSLEKYAKTKNEPLMKLIADL